MGADRVLTTKIIEASDGRKISIEVDETPRRNISIPFASRTMTKANQSKSMVPSTIQPAKAEKEK